MAETWKVHRRRVDGSFTGNAVFEGTEDDARRFISENYPRVHIEPGSTDTGIPDALLVSPDGAYESCVGTQHIGSAVVPDFIDTDERGVPKTDDSADEDVDPDDEDVEPDVEPARPAKKTTAKKTAAPSAPTF